MVSMGNFTCAYARALLLVTPADMLVKPQAPNVVRGLKPADLAQMEKEMEMLERDFRVYQDTYGQNALALNVVQRHVKRLLDNPAIKRFLAKRYAEILEELVDITALEALQ